MVDVEILITNCSSRRRKTLFCAVRAVLELKKRLREVMEGIKSIYIPSSKSLHYVLCRTAAKKYRDLRAHS
jgi:hypothetical protein